jgi:hypothetical protein
MTDDLIFLIILFVIFIGIPVGFLVLLYYIGKRLESKRTGIILSSSVGLFFLLCFLYLRFEDQLFTRSNARELLLTNKIELKDDFEIIENETNFAIGDFHQRFELTITTRDKSLLISHFKRKTDSINSILEKYPNSFKEYHENSDGFSKENSKHSEIEEDFIFISKKENKLIYELVQE